MKEFSKYDPLPEEYGEDSEEFPTSDDPDIVDGRPVYVDEMTLLDEDGGQHVFYVEKIVKGGGGEDMGFVKSSLSRVSSHRIKEIQNELGYPDSRSAFRGISD